jgi:hypothetical protein
MRSGGSNRSGFAAHQAALQSHGQRPTVIIRRPNFALLTARQVEQLTEPFDATARTALLEVGREMVQLVDATEPPEQQLSRMREYLEGRRDPLLEAVTELREIVAEILTSVAELSERQSKAISEVEPASEHGDPLLARVVLVVAGLLTGLEIGDPRLSGALRPIIEYLVFVYVLRKDL